MTEPTPEPDPRYCGSRKKGGDGTCRRPAGWGTDHAGHGRCKLHGGRTPTGRQYAQKQIAAVAVATYGLPADIDPGEALLQEVQRAAGHVKWLEAVIAGLRQEDLTRGTRYMRRTTGPAGDVTVSEVGAQLNPWLQLYHQERKMLREVSRDALAAGIDERMLRLEERRADAIVGLVQGILDDLHLTHEQRDLVATVVPARLRMLGAETA